MSASGAMPFPLPPRYEPPTEILAGGQGAVYICRDKLLDRLVAIKALHAHVSEPTLDKEISASAQISSKHVVEIYDRILGAGGKTLALVLEYVPGDTFHDKAKHPAQLRDKVFLLYQLACGVSDIHRSNVIHRDLKPLNMKVDASGVLKIFDLGISNLDADSASTVGGAGTFMFRAPELYQPMPVAVTRAVDVYAIGVIAWYVFADGVPAALLTIPPLTAGSSLPSILTVDPALAPIADVLDLTLAVSPSARPSAADTRDGLEAFLTRDRRRAVFSLPTTAHELSKVGSTTSIKAGELGSVRVSYSNGKFVVRDADGSVYLNNTTAIAGQALPDSCVVTFGEPTAGSKRVFVAFDVSQPEIVL